MWADSGYRGAHSRVDGEGLQWHIAVRPSDIAKLPEGRRKTAVRKKEHRKVSVRTKVEHPFRVIKRQFGPCPGSRRCTGPPARHTLGSAKTTLQPKHW